MAINLKGWRKIIVNDKIYHWKVKTHYYGKWLHIYNKYDGFREVLSDEYYGNISISITPYFVCYCIINNLTEVNNDDLKKLLFDRVREKKINRILKCEIN